MRSFWRLSALGAAIVAGATACGGDNSTIYSRAAYVACLHSHSVRTRSLSQALAGRHTRIAGILESIAPSAVVAHVPDREVVVIAFARDAAGAGRIAAAIGRLAEHRQASAGKIAQEGNTVMVSEPRIAAGTRKILDACRASSAVP